jgi:hypothetical protein
MEDKNKDLEHDYSKDSYEINVLDCYKKISEEIKLETTDCASSN